MAAAIIKISWRVSSSGQVLLGLGQVEGGICGTCFTVESGITISCAHHISEIFIPNKGYDACRVFVVERDGRITQLHEGCFQLFPDYDACVITNFQARHRYKICQKQKNQISACDLRGYEASAGPFKCRAVEAGTAVEIFDANIKTAAQTFRSLTPRPMVFEVNAHDVKIAGKLGYIIDVKAKIGLSGGPMLDASDGSVAALCFMGLPADVHEKTQIGAIDIRTFPFI